MRRRDKPFIVCRRGSGFFTIRPRGAKGWLQTVIWAALVVPLVVWFSGYTGASEKADDFVPALFLFCMGILAWVIAGLWWVFTRAEVVAYSVILRDKQQARRANQRQD